MNFFLSLNFYSTVRNSTGSLDHRRALFITPLSGQVGARIGLFALSTESLLPALFHCCAGFECLLIIAAAATNASFLALI